MGKITNVSGNALLVFIAHDRSPKSCCIYHLLNFLFQFLHLQFFLYFILIYKLNIQIQISLLIGNLYSAGLITGISSVKKKKKKKKNYFNMKNYMLEEDC